MSFLTQIWDSPFDPTETTTFKDHFGKPPFTKLDSPLELFWRDVGNIFKNSYLLADMLKPFLTLDKDDELYPLGRSGLAMVWWTAFSLFQAIPLFILVVFSVAAISLVQLLTAIHSLLIWRPIQGPAQQVWPPTPLAHHNPRHRWVYINGIATGAHGLQQNLRVLSERFNAPILGVHNRTYGFLGDIIECVLQRAFAYRTVETRLVVPILKRYLEQPAGQVEKIVLVAHSQGGINASQVLDQLFGEVSWDRIHGRLEVYTFGSAAQHFRNPWFDGAKTCRLVTRMEHYCHERDMVTSFGALSALRRDEVEGGPYHGEVFIWKGKPGHLLNQHYLKGMFNFNEDGSVDEDFLNMKIEPYEAHRPKKADQLKKAVQLKKADQLMKEGRPAKKDESGRWYVLPGERVEAGQKRVKDASHLWTYMVRDQRVDEGVDVKKTPVNGATHAATKR